MRSWSDGIPRFVRNLAVLSACTATAAACTKSNASSPSSTGGLEIVLETDMAIPQDIDEVRLQVTQDGKSLLSIDRAVGAGALLMPATFEVPSTGNPDSVSIQGIAYKSGQPRVERDAVTPFPQDDIGELRLPLNYLCVGTAQSDPDGGVSSTCPSGLTCVQGACMTSTVPASAVPAYNPSTVYGGAADAGVDASLDAGTSGGCFDVQDCFAAATAATVNETTCSLALPAGVSGTDLNVALQFPVGGDGVCGTAACWVVFNEGTDWTLSGSTLQLPQGACTGAASQGATVVLTTACPAKTESVPECGSWSSVTTPVTHPTTSMSPLGQSCSGPSSQSCGLCGTQTRMCTNGTWSAWGACSGEGVCQPNATQSCAIAGASETCTSSCQWGPCACASGQSECMGTGTGTATCVALDSDVNNCGTCGNDCLLLPHVSSAGVACTAGECTYTCLPGYADCADAGSGCMTSVAAAATCGGCAVACPTDAPLCAPASDAGTVDSGTTYACATGCPSSAPTLCSGSCVDLQSSSESCGACGMACTGGTTCQSGVCACPSGMHACSGTCVSNTSTMSCGTTSCTACPVPTGGTATCNGTACGSMCPTGDTLCGTACVDELTNSSNCGACGTVCGGGAGCQSGECACPTGMHACSGTCVSNTSTMSCGTTSCTACPVPTGGTATCNGTACGSMCPTGDTLCGTACVDELTNSSNCGACGTVCAGGTTCQNGTCACPSGTTNCGGTCTVGACQPVALASEGEPFAIAINSTSVFWTDLSSGSVLSVPIAGGSAVTLAAGVGAVAVAADATNVYWLTDTTVVKMALAGGSPVTLASGQSSPSAIAVEASNVYWVNGGTAANDFEDGSVMQVPAAGGTPVTLASGQNDPLVIAVDAHNVYWGATGALMQMPLGGGTPATIAFPLLPIGIAVDANNVYWADLEASTVNKVPIGGGNSVALASGQSLPNSSITNCVAVDATNVYWTTFEGDTVMQVPIAGGNPVNLATQQDLPDGIAVDTENVYWTDVAGTVMKFPK